MINSDKDTSKENDLGIKQSNVVRYDNSTFYVIYRNDAIRIDELLVYDALIIEVGDNFRTTQILRQIRSHYNPEFYLKTIFLLGANDTQDPFITGLIDGIIRNLQQLDIVNDVFIKIFLKTTQLYFPNSLSFEAQIVNKVINFLFTREKKELLAYPYLNSSFGYTYPIISVNFSQEEEWKALEILEIAAREGLLIKYFYEKIYLCNKCKGGFLSYREVCPKCSSSNIITHDLIHHFPCAFVGPIYDFKNEIDHQMICPKCYKPLKHIGVDYDKPAFINICLSCDHKFQDTFIKAKCIACSSDVEVDKLISETVNKYTLSKKGELVALKGYVATKVDVNEIRGVVDVKTFKLMIGYEIERLRQRKFQSSIASIHIMQATELFAMLGNSGQKEFLEDIVTQMRLNLRTSDLISFYDASTILFGLNDLSPEVAKIFMEQITNMLKDLLNEYYKNFNIKIKYIIKELVVNMSSEAQFNQLVEEML